MKRILFLFLLLGSFAVTTVAADELKDNRLQIDNSRIEKEQELNFGAQSEGTKSLFVAEKSGKNSGNEAVSKQTVGHRSGTTVFCYTGANGYLPFQGAFSAGNGKIVQVADEFEK